MSSAEQRRLAATHDGPVAPWRRWGPYVAERSWGTVREDYSADGEAWAWFPHDHARSKAYRWGEDGLAGFCDRYQILCFAPAFWNTRDPILKERLFGLAGGEGNHGEDVKEYYFYLDATPTHSYMKYLYKYPQAAFPYRRLIDENRARFGRVGEYELLDTGVFDDDRYFDIFIEYAKLSPDDICIRIEACNRGDAAAPLHILPQLWFRNTWGWGAERLPQPVLRAGPSGPGWISLVASDDGAPSLPGLPFEYRLGTRYLYAAAGGRPLFTDNETNVARLHPDAGGATRRFVKDAFHRHLTAGEDCVNPDGCGTKSCLDYVFEVAAKGSVVLDLRLSDRRLEAPLAELDSVLATRRAEADEFYAALHPPRASADECRIQRQALAGMLWGKQIYLYDVKVWRDGDDPATPPAETRRNIRNKHWQHLNSMRVLSVPDKWEYPWFAAWDLAFQCIPLALVDPEFAKEQLWLLLFEQFQHPNGQIPAYEWEFSDLNPPVHAWAVWRVYNMDRIRSGKADRFFLERAFHKLLINFAWWVNKVDDDGNNIFEGGFLGLDNITVVDRSRKPQGTTLEQSDATGWMGMFCLNLMRIALELAKENRAYEGLASKFFQHYVYVGAAMKHMGNRNYQLWDEEDKFFYDVLRYPDGDFHKFRVRSLVGLVPLYAVERLEEDWIVPFPEFRSNLHWFLKHRQDSTRRCVSTVERGGGTVHVLAVVDEQQMRHLVERICDPAEFRSDFGLRSLSRHHLEHPFRFGDQQVGYEPAESLGYLKGGNSNWRGPIWLPMNFMLIESLRKLGKAYGPLVEIAAADGDASLDDIARGFADRLIAIFARNDAGKRPVHGDSDKFQNDPYWRDLLLFYEYFDGDSGRGLGASHQTGWTGLVASLIDEWRR